MMPRADVDAEVAGLADPENQRQARIVWEFHNAVWYDMTLAGSLRRLWTRWRRSKPS